MTTAPSRNWEIHIDCYDGPLDLLLQLIELQQLDIYDIPIAVITEQYLRYLDTLASIDLDRASGLLVMAATLLQIKARTLLPPPKLDDESEEPADADPRASLVKMLIEYRVFKRASAELGRLASEFNRSRRGAERSLETPPAMTPEAPLVPGEGYGQLLRAVKRLGPHVIGQSPPIVVRDQFRVARKLRDWLRAFRQHRGVVRFLEVIRSRARAEIVAAFLALLELIRLERARAEQRDVWEDIRVTALPRKKERSHEPARDDRGDPVRQSGPGVPG